MNNDKLRFSWYFKCGRKQKNTRPGTRKRLDPASVPGTGTYYYHITYMYTYGATTAAHLPRWFSDPWRSTAARTTATAGSVDDGPNGTRTLNAVGSGKRDFWPTRTGGPGYLCIPTSLAGIHLARTENKSSADRPAGVCVLHLCVCVRAREYVCVLYLRVCVLLRSNRFVDVAVITKQYRLVCRVGRRCAPILFPLRRCVWDDLRCVVWIVHTFAVLTIRIYFYAQRFVLWMTSKTRRYTYNERILQ